jgi:ADP-ribosylglycohydrolase
MHNTDICISSAEYFVWLVIWALQWESKETLAKPEYSPVKNFRKIHPIHETLLPIIKGSYNYKDESELWFTWHYWYVVDSLEIALRWFFKFDSFEEWMIRIVNLGNDADTNACIYWYLAWAYYWYDKIPDRRKNNVTNKWLIKNLADWLYNKWL